MVLIVTCVQFFLKNSTSKIFDKFLVSFLSSADFEINEIYSVKNFFASFYENFETEKKHFFFSAVPIWPLVSKTNDSLLEY